MRSNEKCVRPFILSLSQRITNKLNVTPIHASEQVWLTGPASEVRELGISLSLTASEVALTTSLVKSSHSQQVGEVSGMRRRVAQLSEEEFNVHRPE